MELFQLKDEEIAMQFKDNPNPKFFSELFRRHHQKIVQKCYRYLKDEEAAKDVSQEVLVRVFLKIDGFEQRACFTTWLYTIIRNRCADHIKKDKKGLNQEISREIIENLKEEVETDSPGEITIELLEELVEKLRGGDKSILLLKYKEGWSIKEIQQSLNLSEGVVKMRLSRAKERLQKLLKDYYHRNNSIVITPTPKPFPKNLK